MVCSSAMRNFELHVYTLTNALPLPALAHAHLACRACDGDAIRQYFSRESGSSRCAHAVAMHAFLRTFRLIMSCLNMRGEDSNGVQRALPSDAARTQQANL